MVVLFSTSVKDLARVSYQDQRRGEKKSFLLKLDLYVALSYVIVVLSYPGRQKRVGQFRTKGGVISSFVQKVRLLIYLVFLNTSWFKLSS